MKNLLENVILLVQMRKTCYNIIPNNWVREKILWNFVSSNYNRIYLLRNFRLSNVQAYNFF